MTPHPAPDRRREREEMVEKVALGFEETERFTGLGALDPEIRRALLAVPRHEFVQPAAAEDAYRDAALSIGAGQTISQPFIVALMTQLAGIGRGTKVLEIGTGSGYQAAVLSALGASVHSIERIEELSDRAAAALFRTGHDAVRLRVGDGFDGWPEEAPFDAILVTAAAPSMPRPLLDQLAAGGRLVVPLGSAGETQQLVLVRKERDGSTVVTKELPVAFVPMISEGFG